MTSVTMHFLQLPKSFICVLIRCLFLKFSLKISITMVKNREKLTRFNILHLIFLLLSVVATKPTNAVQRREAVVKAANRQSWWKEETPLQVEVMRMLTSASMEPGFLVGMERIRANATLSKVFEFHVTTENGTVRAY